MFYRLQEPQACDVTLSVKRERNSVSGLGKREKAFFRSEDRIRRKAARLEPTRRRALALKRAERAWKRPRNEEKGEGVGGRKRN